MRNKGFALSIYPLDTKGKQAQRPYEERTFSSGGSSSSINNKKEITCNASQRYSISISNGSSKHAAVEIYINGAFIGGYPVELRPSRDSVITGFSSHVTPSSFIEKPFQFPDKEPFCGTIEAKIFEVIPKQSQKTRPIKSPKKIKQEDNNVKYCDRGQFDKSDKEICSFWLRYCSPGGQPTTSEVVDLTCDSSEEESEKEEKEREREEGRERKEKESEKEKQREDESIDEEAEERGIEVEIGGIRDKEEDRETREEGNQASQEEERGDDESSEEVGMDPVTEREQEVTAMEECEKEEQEKNRKRTYAESMEADGETNNAAEKEASEREDNSIEESGNDESEDEDEKADSDMEDHIKEEKESGESDNDERQARTNNEGGVGGDTQGKSASKNPDTQKEVDEETKKREKEDVRERIRKGEVKVFDLTAESSDDEPPPKKYTKKIKRKKITKPKKSIKKVSPTPDCPPTQIATPFPLDKVIEPFDVQHITTTNQILSPLAQQMKSNIRTHDNKIDKVCLEYLRKIIPKEKKNKHIDLCAEILKVVTIDNEDARKNLRGSRGVVAKDFIPQNTVIGPYAGKMWGEEEHTEQTTLFSKLAHNTYTHDFDIDIDGVKMLIDALQYGNLTRYINDPIIDSSKPYSRSNQVAEANVKTENVIYNSWPYVLIVSTRDIAPDEEILLEYGADYWAARANIVREHKQMKIIQQKLSKPPSQV